MTVQNFRHAIIVVRAVFKRVSLNQNQSHYFGQSKRTETNPVNQSKLEVITRSRQKARENVHARATIVFGFTSDWLKKGRENFEPITEWSNAKPKQFANYFPHSIENHFNLLVIVLSLKN